MQKCRQTWGLDESTGFFGIIFPLLKSWYCFFWSKFCFGIEGCNFEDGFLCKPGIELLALSTEGFFSALATGIFEGRLFGPTGRPGPTPLLLPSRFLESTDVKLGLLAETNFWDPALACIWPFIGSGFLSSRLLGTCLPLLLKGGLLFGGMLFCDNWPDRASSKLKRKRKTKNCVSPQQ